MIGQQAQEPVLAVVRVLVFIDQQILEALLVLLEHIGIVLKQANSQQDQITEVQRVTRSKTLLVDSVELSGARWQVAAALLLELVGAQAIVLGAVNS